MPCQRPDGLMYSVTNAEGADAMKRIRETVGIDLDPAAAIASAALVQAVERNMVGRDDHILLNLTGRGIRAHR